MANWKICGKQKLSPEGQNEEIKSRLKSGNEYYHSLQNILSYLCCPKI